MPCCFQREPRRFNRSTNFLEGTASRNRKSSETGAASGLRPDLQLLEIRGNVDTRIRKLDEGQYDAIILAEAGLRRRPRSSDFTFASASGTVPRRQPGRWESNAARMTKTRSNCRCDYLLDDLCRSLSRAFFVANITRGCHAPLGVRCTISDKKLRLTGVPAEALMAERIEEKAEGSLDSPEAIGARSHRPIVGVRSESILGHGDPS
ncbi:MAG: hypothetical protein U0936_24110 [Planctomycetaceae bacterium]